MVTNLKKILYGLLIIIIVWAVIFGVDYALSLNNRTPLITFKKIEYDKDDVHVTEYHSLGYKVIEEGQGWIKKYYMKPLWVKTAPDRKFIILDETGEECINGKTYFYEDTYFKYYFSCNQKITLQFGKEKLSLTQALEEKRVTIDELKAEGLPILTESKIEFDFEISIDNKCNMLQADPTKLVKQKEGLYYYCINNANIYVNKKYSSFKDAFNNTIKEDSITIKMKKETTYESGATLYSTSGYRMLVCKNGNVVLGPYGMEYFDIFNDICSK